MELIMKTDLEKSLPKVIDFNHEQLKVELSERLVRYNTLVVTEEGIKDAKSDKAALNKLKTALEDRRKSVKKECLAPYEEFERKIKELVYMIDAPILAIDKQIKSFDDLKKAEKRENIEGCYQSNIGELSELLPLSKIWDERWLNATYKFSDIEKEIADTVFKVKNDLGIIKAMHVECEQQMLDTYLRSRDMSAALAEKTRFEEQQKRIKEYEAAQKKAQQEAVEQKPEPEVVCGTRVPDAVPAGSIPTAPEELKTIKVIFYDTTESFRRDMKALTDKHAIKYGGIK